MSSEIICVTARLDAMPEHAADVAKALEPLVAATRAEDGCLQYDAHQCLDDTCRFLVFEQWASKAHLDAHVTKPHLAAFVEAVKPWLAGPDDVLLWTRVC